MEKEEILLGEEMGRLEIEPIKLIKNNNNDNPFVSVTQRRNSLKSSLPPAKESKCTCGSKKKVKKSGIHKKRPNKILKEPILKVLKNCSSNSILAAEECLECSNKNDSNVLGCDSLNLYTLVHNCNQLSISSSSTEQPLEREDNEDRKWWRKDVTRLQEPKEPKQHSSHSSSCSQQALNPPCDVTIDELASYFETLVHIPKKMSSMAEMMYI